MIIVGIVNMLGLIVMMLFVGFGNVGVIERDTGYSLYRRRAPTAMRFSHVASEFA